jgi:hypothetical protein
VQSPPIETISLNGGLDLIANSDSRLLLAPASRALDDRDRSPPRDHQQAIMLFVQVYVEHAVSLKPL